MPGFIHSWVVKPAYGRTYNTSAAMRADWEAGKDFQIMQGPSHVGAYCSVRDLTDMTKGNCAALDLFDPRTGTQAVIYDNPEV